MIDRLVDLVMDAGRMPRPVVTLAVSHLRWIDTRLQEILIPPARGEIDEYSRVHLADLKDRIERALEAVYVVR